MVSNGMCFTTDRLHNYWNFKAICEELREWSYKKRLMSGVSTKKETSFSLVPHNICRSKLSRLAKKTRFLFNLYRFSFTLNRFRAKNMRCFSFTIFRSFAPEMIQHIGDTSEKYNDVNDFAYASNNNYILWSFVLEMNWCKYFLIGLLWNDHRIVGDLDIFWCQNPFIPQNSEIILFFHLRVFMSLISNCHSIDLVNHFLPVKYMPSTCFGPCDNFDSKFTLEYYENLFKRFQSRAFFLRKLIKLNWWTLNA